jgi:hypothetical protein
MKTYGLMQTCVQRRHRTHFPQQLSILVLMKLATLKISVLQHSSTMDQCRIRTILYGELRKPFIARFTRNRSFHLVLQSKNYYWFTYQFLTGLIVNSRKSINVTSTVGLAHILSCWRKIVLGMKKLFISLKLMLAVAVNYFQEKIIWWGIRITSIDMQDQWIMTHLYPLLSI